MNPSNKGRITRVDQAWAPAHREYIERDRTARIEASGDVETLLNADHAKALRELNPLAVVEVEPLQAAPLAEVVPPSQSLMLPIKFVSAALLTSAKDDIRYYLNGIYVHAVDGEIRICGTDGHRMIVSRFVPGTEIPQWANDGLILPRSELAQVLSLLEKNVGHNCGTPALIIDRAPDSPTVTLRSLNGFASFTLTPTDGKFPDYARVLASAGAALARGESEAMTTTAINAVYLRGATDVAAKLDAKAIHSFLGDGEAAALFTFEGAPDTVLIIMPMRSTSAGAVPDGVVKMLGSAGVSGSIAALRAHATRTAKALTLATSDREREQLEARKSDFEARIAHLMQITADGPKQLEHREAA